MHGRLRCRNHARLEGLRTDCRAPFRSTTNLRSEIVRTRASARRPPKVPHNVGGAPAPSCLLLRTWRAALPTQWIDVEPCQHHWQLVTILLGLPLRCSGSSYKKDVGAQPLTVRPRNASFALTEQSFDAQPSTGIPPLLLLYAPQVQSRRADDNRFLKNSQTTFPSSTFSYQGGSHSVTLRGVHPKFHRKRPKKSDEKLGLCRRECWKRG